MKKVLLAVGIVVLLAVGSVLVWKMAVKPNINKSVACTEEAKLCPDGSAVGRTEPNCAFAECPVELSVTDSWLTYTDTSSGYYFLYPEKLDTEYIHPVEWPPQVVVSGTPFVCEHGGSEIATNGETVEKIIGTDSYCVNTKSEGAAGSIYTSYSYSFANELNTITLSFTLRSVQCDNYDDPQKTACKNERDSFQIDKIVGEMARSGRAHGSSSQVVKNPMSISTSSEIGWVDVHSKEYGFVLKIPSDWKIGRYYGVVAFDPESVASQDEFLAEDKALGKLTVRAVTADDIAGIINIEMAPKNVGPNDLSAWYQKIVNQDGASNPWYDFRTIESYYIRSGEKGYILTIVYPNSEASDQKLQSQIAKIVGSFTNK